MLECRARMPAYMVPAGIELVAGPLPRNPNGKIDRKLLATDWLARHMISPECTRSAIQPRNSGQNPCPYLNASSLCTLP